MLLFLVQAVHLSRTLVASDDEAGYLTLGRLALRGEISLYQDEIAGGRVPLPFYVLGLSQVPFGPNLWAGRLLSVALAAGALLLTVRTGAILAGPLSGVLAGLLLATQGAVVGYFATAGYHALTALVLMGVLQLAIGPGAGGRTVWSALGTGLLFLTRTHVHPLVPYLVVAAALRTRGLAGRLVVVAAGLLTPAAFLLWDRSHWKLLAHVPGLRVVADSFGYHSVFFFNETLEQASGAQLLWSVLLFARRYESWTIGAIGLAAVFGWSWLRGRWRPGRLRLDAVFLAALLLYSLVALAVIFQANVKWAIAYFPTFAPLAAVLMGAAFAAALTNPRLDVVARVATVGSLAAALTLSVLVVRNPLFPVPAGQLFLDDAVARMERIAKELRAHIPPGARVFLLGHSLPLHLAERLPYLQQVLTPWTFVEGHAESWRIQRSGLWGPAQMVAWLGDEADYAVVQPALVEQLRGNRWATAQCLDALLEANFRRVARLDGYPWAVYDVYRRESAGPRSPGVPPPGPCLRLSGHSDSRARRHPA
jgi:4-amino-4-deoxy-L-arabinose transferase-like glycosyltransferase